MALLDTASDRQKFITNWLTNPGIKIDLDDWERHGVCLDELYRITSVIRHFITGLKGYFAHNWQHAFLIKLPERRLAIQMMQSDSYGNNAAHFSALMGEIDVLAKLMETSLEALRAVNENGYSLAHFAAANSDSSVLYFIYSQPALSDLLTRPAKDNTLPFHIAIQSGIIENLEFFCVYHLENWAAKAQRSSMNNALDFAAYSHNSDMLVLVANTMPSSALPRDEKRWVTLGLSSSNPELSTLVEAAGKNTTLAFTTVANHNNTALYSFSQNSERWEENKARLTRVFNASCMGLFQMLMPLCQSFRQAWPADSQVKASLKMPAEVYMVVISFLVPEEIMCLFMDNKLAQHTGIGFFKSVCAERSSILNVYREVGLLPATTPSNK